MLRARFFYVVSVPLLVGFIVYMLSYMPAANTSLVVKIDVGLAWCAHNPVRAWASGQKQKASVNNMQQAVVIPEVLPQS